MIGREKYAYSQVYMPYRITSEVLWVVLTSCGQVCVLLLYVGIVTGSTHGLERPAEMGTSSGTGHEVSSHQSQFRNRTRV